MKTGLIFIAIFLVLTAFSQQPKVQVVVNGKPVANPQVSLVNGGFVMVSNQGNSSVGTVSPLTAVPTPVPISPNGQLKVPVAINGKIASESEYTSGNGGQAIMLNGKTAQNKAVCPKGKTGGTSVPVIIIPDGIKVDSSRKGILVGKR
ncbi:MAG: hypothetical protein NT004_06450 [Bacteroidetes bacterium]|nr:hypothetical protein [Bacteroidota bacterium]